MTISELIETNLNTSIETIVVFLLFIGSLILMAKGFKEGIALLMASLAVAFTVLYELGMDYRLALTGVVMCIVVMALLLFFVSKSAPQRGYT